MQLARCVAKSGVMLPPNSSAACMSSAARSGQSSRDVVIVGGGVIGSSIASFLAAADPTLRVSVVERDPSYSFASSPLSVGGCRQQFSNPENIAMSRFCTSFVKNAAEHLDVPGHDPVDVCFREFGYLFLASPAGEATLRANHELQQQHDCTVQLLSPDELQSTFPWMTNVDDIALGAFGYEGEGFFDPWSLLTAFVRKAKSAGVEYVNGHVVGMKADGTAVTSVEVLLPDGTSQSLPCGVVVNAAGAFSSRVAGLAGVHDLPVSPRKRCVFVYQTSRPDNAADRLAMAPLVVDPSGVYFRPEGDGFLCGMSPPEHLDPEGLLPSDLTVSADDHEQLFENTMWPVLASRCSTFEAIRVSHSWAGWYGLNTFDANALLGRHRHTDNMLFATGFSGHGIQQGPAVGRGIAELIVGGDYKAVDLTRLRADRYLDNAPVLERNIV